MNKLDWEEFLYWCELAIKREQEIDDEVEREQIESWMDTVWNRNPPEQMKEAMNDMGAFLNKWEPILKGETND